MGGTSRVRSIPKSPKTESQLKDGVGNYFLGKMAAAGVAPTRENYLERVYGDRNYQPDAEQELDMPPQFRKLLPPDPVK